MGKIPLIMAMTPSELISQAKEYAQSEGLQLTTVSRKILGSGKELGLIEAGARNVGYVTLQKAAKRLRDLESAASRGPCP